ncbi:MFS transporter [Haliangium sp.]|uniref:MFS transporter n=1 Tax=Haliangium sp. TaxID=2663208 RepID=UPI003D151B2E
MNVALGTAARLSENEPVGSVQKSRSWLTRPVVLLGVVSLLTDTATEMIMPLLPVFLGTLGAGALALGWIEGLADATASVLKLLSGRWSDRIGRRRPFVLGGYGLASLARPFVAAATAAWHVLAVRVADRVGKGLRTSPRDALIAGSVDEDQRGAAFGLHRAMDHAGAVLGPLIAFGFLLAWPNELRTLFWLTAIPGAAAVAVVVFGVREATDAPADEPGDRDPDGPHDGRLLRLLIPLGLFTLGNASDLFLLLKAGATRAPLVTLPLLWMGLHVVKMLASIPGGRLSDRWGRTRTIGLGWVFYAGIYAGFAFADSQATIWALFVAYGIYHGLTEGAERALVAELVPSVRWGSGFGWYHLTLGGLTLVASVLFGGLWEAFGSRTAFLTSAALALAAVLCLAVIGPRLRNHPVELR